MKKRKDVLIIIPAYNEEKTIGALLERLKQQDIAEIADILVMNDASRDGTEEKVREYGVDVVTQIFNLGYGSGLQTGYKYAVQNGYQYVIQMDADGQHDVCNIRPIYEKLTTKDENGKVPDIVLGSRFLHGWKDYPTTFLKKIAYRFFGFMIFLGTGKRFTDATTGLQGLNREAFTFYAQFNQFDDQYPDANMILQMVLLGFEVIEIPAVMHVRVTGVSMHSGLKPIMYMFRMMFSMMAIWLKIKVYHVGTRVR